MENITQLYTTVDEGKYVRDSDIFLGSRSDLPYRDVYSRFVDVLNPASVLVVMVELISNILNILVFTKMGARDTVTVSLLALSISDLAFLFLVFPHVATKTLEDIQEWGVNVSWLVEPEVIWVPFYWFSIIFYETSMLITVYIAIARCACVAIPLKFKATFTASRSLASIAVIFFGCSLLRLPKFITFHFYHGFVHSENTTKLSFTQTDDGGLSNYVNDLVNRNVLPWSAFTIIFISVAVMVIKLQASAKFRMAATSTRTMSHKPVTKFYNWDASPLPSETKTIQNDDAAYQSSGLSTKENQMVKSIILVAIVFMICQMPFVLNSLIRSFDPRFDITVYPGPMYPRHFFLYAAASTLATFFAYVNATINIFVYYNVNSRYNERLRKLCQ